jgi:hypothetical protein
MHAEQPTQQTPETQRPSTERPRTVRPLRRPTAPNSQQPGTQVVAASSAGTNNDPRVRAGEPHSWSTNQNTRQGSPVNPLAALLTQPPGALFTASPLIRAQKTTLLSLKYNLNQGTTLAVTPGCRHPTSHTHTQSPGDTGWLGLAATQLPARALNDAWYTRCSESWCRPATGSCHAITLPRSMPMPACGTGEHMKYMSTMPECIMQSHERLATYVAR